MFDTSSNVLGFAHDLAQGVVEAPIDFSSDVAHLGNDVAHGASSAPVDFAGSSLDLAHSGVGGFIDGIADTLHGVTGLFF